MSPSDREHAQSCRELAEAMTEYIEDALTPADRVLIDKHLAMCRGCRNYLDQMERTIDAVQACGHREVPTETKERLLDLFERWKEESLPT